MTKLRRAEKVGRKYQNPTPTKMAGAELFFKVLPEVVMGRKMRVPQSPLGPFCTDPTVYQNLPASGLRITWMGHSTLLLEIDGVRVLTDPVWDERASPMQWAGPKRFFAPPLPLDKLPPLDLVLVSHDHYDHLGAGTIRQLSALQPEARWVTSLGVAAILRSLGVRGERITELDWTETARVEAISGGRCDITSLPSRHFSGRSAFNRFETLWGSFVLRGGTGRAVYFGADSGWWEGFAEIGAVHGPFDLTMLEIGAYNELWKEIHMGPDGAARAFREMGATGLLMPIHWGLFDLALHPWQWPMERMLELAEVGGLKLWAPEPGLPTEVVDDIPMQSNWWCQTR